MLCIILAAGVVVDLDSVLGNHQTSREMIHTLSCRYRLVVDGSVNDEGEYLRVGDDSWFANRSAHFPGVFQVLRKNGELWTLQAPRPPPQAGRVPDANESQPGEVLQLALYNVKLDSRRTASLMQAAATASRKECKQFGEQYEIRLQLADRTHALWLSPAHNYACVKSVETFFIVPGVMEEITREVISFTEKGSIYFPTKVQIGTKQSGKLVRTMHVELNEVELNAPIAADRLRIRFPKDTVLADRIAGAVYYVDENGNRLRDHEKLRIIKEDWKNPIAGAVRSQTHAEPGNPWWYAAGAFGGMMVLALLLLYWQRRRLRMTGDAAWNFGISRQHLWSCYAAWSPSCWPEVLPDFHRPGEMF